MSLTCGDELNGLRRTINSSETNYSNTCDEAFVMLVCVVLARIAFKIQPVSVVTA
jgi:hypothetical protein